MVALALTARHPVRAPIAADPAQTASATNPWALNATPEPSRITHAAPRTVRVLSRDGSGQFNIDGFVNGRQTRFLIDTGADLVAIPTAEAERLGITVRDSDFRPMLRTASGTADGAAITLDRIEVAGATLTHVPAVVVRGLETNLLGQSALKQLGRVELRGDAMVIAPG
jgi:aspartyl protease family protein